MISADLFLPRSKLILLSFRRSGLVPEQKSQVEEAGALRADPAGQDALRCHLRPVGAAQDGQLRTGTPVDLFLFILVPAR